MEPILPPAPNPCGSCPYRRDVPSGVWDEEEYAKLPEYDMPTAVQPPAVFLCHQQDGHLCSGWAACHDMNESLGLRLAVSLGAIEVTHVHAILNHSTPVPLFASGAEAAAHGRAEITAPGDRAAKTIDKLTRKRGTEHG